jgi:hypothetical protein
MNASDFSMAPFRKKTVFTQVPARYMHCPFHLILIVWSNKIVWVEIMELITTRSTALLHYLLSIGPKYLSQHPAKVVEASWNVMAHAQKPDFVFRRNERVHLNRLGCQFGRLLAAELSASAVVMLNTPCSEVVWRVLATDSIRQFPLHFPSRTSPCAITFQLESTIREKMNSVATAPK